MAINLYADSFKPTISGHGIDIASQRADDLDLKCLDVIKSATQPLYAIDIACGYGGQAKRMMQAGAMVRALDIDDYTAEFKETGIHFYQADMRNLSQLLPTGSFNIVVCQRAIQYLSYTDALSFLQGVKQILKPKGYLFLSAGGLSSELSQGYVGKEYPIEQRFHPLANPMAQKHHILQSVCLYSEAELKQLLVRTDFKVTELFSSPFGKVKAVAIK